MSKLIITVEIDRNTRCLHGTVETRTDGYYCAWCGTFLGPVSQLLVTR